MSRVIFLGLEGYGHINPTLGIVKELVRRGEEVYYYSINEFKTKIEGAGAIFKNYKYLEGNADPEKLDQMVQMEMESSRNGDSPDLTEATEDYIGHLKEAKAIADEVYEEIKEINPHYIIHDSLAYWGKQVAIRLGIPAICSVTMFAYCDKITEIFPQFVFKALLHLDDKFLADIEGTKKEFNRISEECQREYSVEGFDFMDMYSCHEGLNIVYTSKYFQPFGELFDESYKFIGPSFSHREEAGQLPFELADGEKVVYISFGTIFNNNVDFYKRCIEALKGTNKKVVISTGIRINPGELGDVPENFVIMQHVPQIEVLKRTELFITHAGMNSTNEALYEGVPLIVIPQGFDQFLVAEQVERLRAGVYIRNKNASVEEIREAVEKIYSTDEYAKNSMTIGREHRNAGGYLKAVEEIMKYKEAKGVC